jgi:tRNA G26 N,N-dimethylase Trm1
VKIMVGPLWQNPLKNEEVASDEAD